MSESLERKDEEDNFTDYDYMASLQNIFDHTIDYMEYKRKKPNGKDEIDNGDKNEIKANEQNDNKDLYMLPDLTQKEQVEMNKLVVLSKKPNKINYVEDSTYNKYLNIIERDKNLPPYALKNLMKKESRGKLYTGGRIKGSSAGAKGLFQLMPSTADSYMKNQEVLDMCGVKKFKSRDEFLKNPLATARAAGIILSKYMEKYNFQTSLACYNWGPGNYERKIGKRNLTKEDFPRLPKETRGHLSKITTGVLEDNHIIMPNSEPSVDELLSDLGKYSWSRENINGNSMA